MPSDSTTDANETRLVARARQGDPAAVTELCERWRARLVQCSYRYLGHAEEAEDAAQDVLTKVVVEKRWPTGSFRAWIYRLTRNHCLDLRKRRRDGRVGVGSYFGSSSFPSPRTGPKTALDRQEQNEELRRHLALLAPEHAEVLALRYFDDLSRKEIADVLELPESVVKSRLFEARRTLARRMEEGST